MLIAFVITAEVSSYVMVSLCVTVEDGGDVSFANGGIVSEAEVFIVL